MTSRRLALISMAALLLAAARGRTHFVYPSRYQWLWRLKRLSPGGFQKWLPRLLAR